MTQRGRALFLLLTFTWGLAVPMVYGVAPAITRAQEQAIVGSDPGINTSGLPASNFPGGGGGLGGLFGLFQGPVGMFLLVMLLSRLLGNLFGGGGATPQTGPVEEQPPLPPSVGPQRTGPRGGAGGEPSPEALQNQALFHTGDHLQFPRSLSLSAGQRAVTVYNTDTAAAHQVVVRRQGATRSTTIDLPAGGVHVVRFGGDAGTFEFLESETILGTVVVPARQ